VPLSETVRLEQLKDAEINEAKKILATEATKLCHGAAAADQAAGTAAQAFTGGNAAGLPTYMLATGETVRIIDVIVKLGMAASAGEAKRLIEQGGVKINDVPVTATTTSLTTTDLGAEDTIRLLVGKKRHGLVKKSQ
jgi:tyrosyl-tRNA synthetase